MKKLLAMLLLLTLPAMADEAADNRAWRAEILTFAASQPATVQQAMHQIVDNADALGRLNTHAAHDELMATMRKIKDARAHPEGAILRDRLDAPIGNFGVVSNGILYRGAQPSPAGVRWLAAQGVKVVVLLRQPGVEETNFPGYSRADYIRDIQKLGMRCVEIPVKDGTVPTDAQIQEFLHTVDTANGPVFVHCAAGVGRTGVMCGRYERAHGVSAPDALHDARRYGMRAGKPDHDVQAKAITR